MKKPIEWHEKALENWTLNLKIREQELLRSMTEYRADLKWISYYKAQIDAAKKQKKDGFDSELFLKNKKPNGE